ncbi:solute carrier family 22 member 7-like [Bicyclus anynana]|uniref:Solute carrier family 22 member 7-like n=1 Tax=Bicyclus anynana TaxID=110368 RepID=A0ABM3LPX9_BICAN|nr:solute carrier family 22 member 7-like [Bicyclus anynana]
MDNDKETIDAKAIDLDDVLTNEAGEFGLFQLRTTLLLAILVITFGTIQDYVFSTAAIPHRCRIPECGEDENLLKHNPEWIKNAVPEYTTGLASCERYATIGLEHNGTSDHCPASLFDQSLTIPCEDLVYAKDNTVTYEFDLGCAEWLRVLAGTLYSAGTLLALGITGVISDNFGRKVALMLNVVSLGVFGVMRAFSVNYTMYLILQLVQSALGSGASTTAYIMAAEIVGPKYRIIVGVSCTAMFATGEAVLGAVAWAISPWRRVCTTPFWWIAMIFGYYGMSINSTSLSDTMHLNYILVAVIGIPAFYVSAFALARIGRRATISSDFPILRLLVYLLGKFFISLVGTALYLYTLELYPTEYRHTLLGFSSMLGRVGAILAPLTPALMTYYHGLPSLLFGGMAAIAGLLALTQPETLGCKLPDTLEEAEAIGTPSLKIT